MPQEEERGPTPLKTLYLLFILLRTLLAVYGQEPWLGKQEFSAYCTSSLPLAPGETVWPGGWDLTLELHRSVSLLIICVILGK